MTRAKCESFLSTRTGIRNNLVIVHLFAVFQLMSANSSGCNVWGSVGGVRQGKPEKQKKKVNSIVFASFYLKTSRHRIQRCIYVVGQLKTKLEKIICIRRFSNEQQLMLRCLIIIIIICIRPM